MVPTAHDWATTVLGGTRHNPFPMVRFIHAADLRLGLVHRFFDVDARARYAQARFDALTSIGELAASEDASFVVVAGDTFATNHVRPRTVVRAVEALAAIPRPVYLLPGSHDPLDAATVFRSPTFIRSKPPNVTLLETTDPVEPPGAPGVRIVGAPWRTRHPLTDPSAGALDAAPAPDPDTTTILVAHGTLDALASAPEPSSIRHHPLEQAVKDRRVGFVALGGRPSTTKVGDTNRIWYAGAPEPIEFDGTDVGNVLVVDIDGERCDVARRNVAGWRLRTETIALDTGLGAAALQARLDMMPAKERTVVRLALTGRISLTEQARLDRIIEHARQAFASIEDPAPTSQIRVRPTDEDFADLGLTGFASAAVARLRRTAEGPDDTSAEALDALSMLVRLARGSGTPA